MRWVQARDHAGRVLALPSQTLGLVEQYGLTRVQTDRELWAVDLNDGSFSGAAAVNRVLTELGTAWSWLAGAYRIAPIRRQQQPVAWRDIDRPSFENVKRLCLFRRDRPLLTAGVSHDDALIVNLNNFNGFVLRNSFDSSMKPEALARAKVARIGLLRGCPVQGNMSLDGYTAT